MRNELYDKQVQALEAICATREAGLTRILVQMATGTGKTTVFSELPAWTPMRAWADPLGDKRKGAFLMVLAHRDEIIDQTCARLQRQTPGLLVSIEQGDRHANSYSEAIVASVNTLAARNFFRARRLAFQHPNLRVVIVDEAHHAAANSYRGVLTVLGYLPPGQGDAVAAEYDDHDQMERALAAWDETVTKDKLLLGFTATPNRTDEIGLGCVFQTIAFSYPVKQAIDDGRLVPIKPWMVETVEHIDKVKVRAGDFAQGELSKAVNTERRNWLAAKAYQEYAPGRAAIAFTVDVQHAFDAYKTFESAGIRSLPVHGEMPKADRAMALRMFTDGQIDIITNCMVLTEGTDLPRTSCIIHMQPTKSATAYEQKTGRGLRLYPQKTDCVLIDLVDIAGKHSLMAAPMLYGLPPNLKTKGKDLRELADDVEQFLERNPGFNIEGVGRLSMDDLLMRARSVELWTVSKPVWKDCKLAWVKVGAEDYRIQYPFADGLEILRVTKDLLGHYDVSATIRPRDGGAVRQRTLATRVHTAEAGAKIAETFVDQERHQALRLMRKDAYWKTKPMTENQRRALVAKNIPTHRRMTAGEASELLDLHAARRGR
jgi:superfamily II DNA or RNA helicase